MRISENTYHSRIQENIAQSKEKLGQLQLQLSNLKKFNTLSDCPSNVFKLLELKTEQFKGEQFQMNAHLAYNFLTHTDHTLASLSEILIQAKEIAISQANAPTFQLSTRSLIVEELNQLLNQALSLANIRIGDRYILGGFKTQSPPFQTDGTYCGDQGLMNLEISNGIFIIINIPGSEIFNVLNCQKDTENEIQKVNFFEIFEILKTAIFNGEWKVIRDCLDDLEILYHQIIATRAKIGSKLQNLNATCQTEKRQCLTQAALAASLGEADLAHVVSEIGKEEATFHSALASSKKFIQPHFIDFLK